MGARRFIPPEIVFRRVAPTATDPVVVARGGLQAIAIEGRRAMNLLIAYADDATNGTHGMDPDRVAEAHRYRDSLRHFAEIEHAAIAQRRAARAVRA